MKKTTIIIIAFVLPVLGIVHFYPKINSWLQIRNCPAFIPSDPYLLSDYASLDFKHVLMFLLEDGSIGFIHFNSADIKEARYDCGLFKWNEDAKRMDCLFSVKNKIIQHRSKSDLPKISFADFRLFWLPPTALYFTDRMKYVALIPVEAMDSIQKGSTNGIVWSPVLISAK